MDERLEYGKKYKVRLPDSEEERDAWYIGSSVNNRGTFWHYLLLESKIFGIGARVINFSQLENIEGDRIFIHNSRNVKLTNPQREYAKSLLKKFQSKTSSTLESGLSK